MTRSEKIAWSIGPVLGALSLGAFSVSCGERRGTTAPDAVAAAPVEAAEAAPAGEVPDEPPADASAGEAPVEGDAAQTPPPADATTAGESVADAGKPAASAGLPAALHPRVDASCGKDPGVGTKAAAFQLKTPEGKDISLASLRGKVVLLNFWGTWCKPCLKELPEFDRLVRHYRKHGAVLVAVATDTEPEKVLEFARERKLAAKLALGGEDLAKKYDSPNFPFSFVIDDKGTIRGSYRSYRPECIGKVEQDLRAALEQRAR